MADQPTNHSEPTQVDGQGQPLPEELRREHQLVRSAGTISKPVIALAFGVAFLLAAALVGQVAWTILLGAIGAACVTWALFAWGHSSRQRTR